MSIQANQTGNEVYKDIMLLTGWGSTCAVWDPIIPALTNAFQINCISPSWIIDSPDDGSLANVDDYIETLGNRLKSPTHIIAWSMGGLLAIKLAARFPERIGKLCLIASVPKFVSKDKTCSAIDYSWFSQFTKQYQKEPLATLSKFLTLQVSGDSNAKAALRFLKNVSHFQHYDLMECGRGLNLLGQLDLLETMKTLKCPCLFVQGDKDAVVNPEITQHVASVTHANIKLLAGAAHAPHVSHPDEISEIILNYLQ